MTNKFKQKETVVEQKIVKEPAPPGAVQKSLAKIFSGNILTNEEVIQKLPFLFFVALLLIVYIGYGYYSEKTIIALSVLDKEIKELKAEVVSSKSELSYISKKTQIIDRTKELGLMEQKELPYVILASDN